MKIILKVFVFACSLPFLFGVDFADVSGPGIVFVKDAQAVIGRPATPASVAGVARVTTRRGVGTTAVVVARPTPPPTTVIVTPPPSAAPAASHVPIGTVVQTLPGGCSAIAVSGVSYSECGGVYYKAVSQGNNLAYIVVEKPR